MRRRRRGAGRPRKHGLKRYANGRLVQGAVKRAAEDEMTRREALSVGLSARMRHHRITRAEAQIPELGYLLGRLLRQGQGPGRASRGITRAQHDAGLAFDRLRKAYHHVCNGPKALRAVDPAIISAPRPIGDAGGGETDPARERFIRRRYAKALSAIAAADPQALQALESALDDQALAPGGLPPLVAALQALVAEFGL